MKRSDLLRFARPGIRQHIAELERQIRDLQNDFPEEFITTTPIVLLSPERKTNGNDWPAFTAKPAKKNTKLSEAMKRAWTPERRAEQAKRMRAIITGTTRGLVLEHFKKHPIPLRASDVAEAIGKDAATVRSLLTRMLRDKEVTKSKRGLYGPAPSETRHVNGKKPRATAKDEKRLGTATGVKMQFYEYLKAHGPSQLKDVEKATKKTAASLITSAEAWLAADIIRRVGTGRYEIGPTPIPPATMTVVRP